jgi:hypothetical protein
MSGTLSNGLPGCTVLVLIAGEYGDKEGDEIQFLKRGGME